MAAIQDDKAAIVVPFVLEQLSKHRQRFTSYPTSPPFFLGLNGVQGAGKTVLASILQQTLQSQPHSLPTAVLSIDDFYLSRTQQLELAASYPNNPLLQHRGQPSTHDIKLLYQTLSSLKANHPTSVPQYDKAAFDGQGDRLSPSQWQMLNTDPAKKTMVVILEGWCVGFRPLSASDLDSKYRTAVAATEDPSTTYFGRLGYNTFENIVAINNALHGYDQILEHMNAFVHIDTTDLQYVYEWRLEQETALRQDRGTGMTEQQVRSFVDGYYPSYELYMEQLRDGCLVVGNDSSRIKRNGNQLRLVIGRDRLVRKILRF